MGHQLGPISRRLAGIILWSVDIDMLRDLSSGGLYKVRTEKHGHTGHIGSELQKKELSVVKCIRFLEQDHVKFRELGPRRPWQKSGRGLNSPNQIKLKISF